MSFEPNDASDMFAEVYGSEEGRLDEPYILISAFTSDGVRLNLDGLDNLIHKLQRNRSKLQEIVKLESKSEKYKLNDRVEVIYTPAPNIWPERWAPGTVEEVGVMTVTVVMDYTWVRMQCVVDGPKIRPLT